MKMKKGLLMVVFLLAISSVMAAMSYNKAAVTSASELKVVNTNEALLTLEARRTMELENTVGAKDNTAVVKDGELFFQFGKGIDGGNGAQKYYTTTTNSEYQWNPLFTFETNQLKQLKLPFVQLERIRTIYYIWNVHQP